VGAGQSWKEIEEGGEKRRRRERGKGKTLTN
jgi:hypothetical protein